MAKTTSTSRTHLFKDGLLIVAGIASAGFGLKGFLLSSHFIDGGATGISMLLSQLTNVSLAVLIPVVNLPFIILAYRQIGRRFALRSTLAIAGLSFSIVVVPYPDVTPDLLLTATFGGFFIGAGIGLAMRGGAVLDGTEALALLISRKTPLLKISDVILLLNVVIFGTAAFLLGIELALYSMITYFAASKTIDFIIHGIEQYTAVLIVSPQYKTMQQRVMKQGWGVTSFKSEQGSGKRGNSNEPIDTLYVIVTRLEVSRLIEIIQDIDREAFIIQYPIDDVRGGQVKSMPLH